MRARWIAALLLAVALPAAAADARLAALAERYYDGYYALFPVVATENTGDPRFEAALEIDIAPAHRRRQQAFYKATLRELAGIDVRRLSADERLTHELLAYEARSRLSSPSTPAAMRPSPCRPCSSTSISCGACEACPPGWTRPLPICASACPAASPSHAR
jgi:uncharacterized protein (DUF885 family)